MRKLKKELLREEIKQMKARTSSILLNMKLTRQEIKSLKLHIRTRRSALEWDQEVIQELVENEKEPEDSGMHT